VEVPAIGYDTGVWSVRAETRFGMDLNPDAVQQAAPGVQVLAQSSPVE
jgi:hypothetical protein